MAANINASERNTLRVLYNINVSTVILPPHQHYIYLYIIATRACRPVSIRAGLAVRVATQTYWLGTTGWQGQAEGNGGRALEELDQLDRHLN